MSDNINWAIDFKPFEFKPLVSYEIPEEIEMVEAALTLQRLSEEDKNLPKKIKKTKKTKKTKIFFLDDPAWKKYCEDSIKRLSFFEKNPKWEENVAKAVEYEKEERKQILLTKEAAGDRYMPWMNGKAIAKARKIVNARLGIKNRTSRTTSGPRVAAPVATIEDFAILPLDAGPAPAELVSDLKAGTGYWVPRSSKRVSRPTQKNL